MSKQIASREYAEFYDPRLVAIYDSVNPVQGYAKFYAELAKRLNANSIVDIGCGTGLLTCLLAERGHRMTGLEPASLMLAKAQERRPCGRDVQWILGDVSDLGELGADLAIMTGHVAQFFLDDESWNGALDAIRCALRPGGYVAFESRNPAVQPWAPSGGKEHIDWPTPADRREVVSPESGNIEWWSQVISMKGDEVTYANHYRLLRSGQEIMSVNALKFRSLAGLVASLNQAGFEIESLYGGWDGSPVGATSLEFIVTAGPGQKRL